MTYACLQAVLSKFHSNTENHFARSLCCLIGQMSVSQFHNRSSLDLIFLPVSFNILALHPNNSERCVITDRGNGAAIRRIRYRSAK